MEQLQKQSDWLDQSKKRMKESSKNQKDNEEEYGEPAMVMGGVGMQ